MLQENFKNRTNASFFVCWENRNNLNIRIDQQCSPFLATTTYFAPLAHKVKHRNRERCGRAVDMDGRSTEMTSPSLLSILLCNMKLQYNPADFAGTLNNECEKANLREKKLYAYI